jgi:hypothetical protein
MMRTAMVGGTEERSSGYCMNMTPTDASNKVTSRKKECGHTKFELTLYEQAN